GKQVRHFAYPFGGASEVSGREVEQMARHGFASAVTSQAGVLSYGKINRHALPRYFYGPGLTLNSLQKKIFEIRLKEYLKRARSIS
ncbi:MAG: hypothetical protein P8L39_05220, partial [Halioglobus sp.]|nr:hypothetical protein [Halioglobus sp.]